MKIKIAVLFLISLSVIFFTGCQGLVGIHVAPPPGVKVVNNFSDGTMVVSSSLGFREVVPNGGWVKVPINGLIDNQEMIVTVEVYDLNNKKIGVGARSARLWFNYGSYGGGSYPGEVWTVPGDIQIRGMTSTVSVR